jgi:hypothetical protein
MNPTPTLHLRFVLRDEILQQEHNCVLATKVRVLQQFWAHPDGKDVGDTSDMFHTQMGTWHDVQMVEP